MDIGANVGHRTLPMARIADEVIATEPIPGAFERLMEKVRLNGLDHVKPFEIALGDRTENVDFEILSPRNFVAVRRSDVLTCGAFGTETFAAVRGDEFIRNHRHPQPHLIRLDVRTETARVLEGLAGTLRSARPVLLVVRPPVPFGKAIDTDGLKSLLYEEAEIFTFNESVEDGSFSLDSFDPCAQKLVCIPAEIVRLAYQEGCKNQSHRINVGARIG
jgi:FkbM family methyltransferase